MKFKKIISNEIFQDYLREKYAKIFDKLNNHGFEGSLKTSIRHGSDSRPPQVYFLGIALFSSDITKIRFLSHSSNEDLAHLSKIIIHICEENWVEISDLLSILERLQVLSKPLITFLINTNLLSRFIQEVKNIEIFPELCNDFAGILAQYGKKEESLVFSELLGKEDFRIGAKLSLFLLEEYEKLSEIINENNPADRILVRSLKESPGQQLSPQEFYFIDSLREFIRGNIGSKQFIQDIQVLKNSYSENGLLMKRLESLFKGEENINDIFYALLAKNKAYFDVINAVYYMSRSRVVDKQVSLTLVTFMMDLANISVLFYKQHDEQDLLAKAYFNLGNCYYSLDDDDLSKYYILKSFQLKKVLNFSTKDPSSLSKNLLYLAEIELRSKNYEQAEKKCKEAISLLPKEYFHNRGLINSLLSRIFFANKNEKAYLDSLLESLELFEKSADFISAIKTSEEIGRYYFMKNSDYPLSMKYFKKALDYAHHIKDDTEKAIHLLDIIGIFLEWNLYDQAQKCFDEIFQLNIQDIKLNSIILHDYGCLHQYRGDSKEAIGLFFESIKLKRQINYNPGIGKSSHHIGIIFTEYELFEEALHFLKLSYEIDEVCEDHVGMYKSLHHLGYLFSKMENYDAAKGALEKSLQGKIAYSAPPSSIATTMASLSYVLFHLNDLKAAKDLHVQALKIFKSKKMYVQVIQVLIQDLLRAREDELNNIFILIRYYFQLARATFSSFTARSLISNLPVKLVIDRLLSYDIGLAYDAHLFFKNPTILSLYKGDFEIEENKEKHEDFKKKILELEEQYKYLPEGGKITGILSIEKELNRLLDQYSRDFLNQSNSHFFTFRGSPEVIDFHLGEECGFFYDGAYKTLKDVVHFTELDIDDKLSLGLSWMLFSNYSHKFSIKSGILYIESSVGNKTIVNKRVLTLSNKIWLINLIFEALIKYPSERRYNLIYRMMLHVDGTELSKDDKKWLKSLPTSRPLTKNERNKLSKLLNNLTPKQKQLIMKIRQQILYIEPIIFEFNERANRFLDKISPIFQELLDLTDNYQNLIISPGTPLMNFPFHLLRKGESYLFEHVRVTYLPHSGLKPELEKSEHLEEDKQIFAISSKIFNLSEWKCIAGLCNNSLFLKNPKASELSMDEYNFADVLHFVAHAYIGSKSNYSYIALGDHYYLPDIIFLKPANLVCITSCNVGLHEEGQDSLSFATLFLTAGARKIIAPLWPVSAKASSYFFRIFYLNRSKGHDDYHSYVKALRRLKKKRRFSLLFMWGSIIYYGI